MHKRILSSIIAALVAVGMTACGKDEESSASKGDKTSSSGTSAAESAGSSFGSEASESASVAGASGELSASEAESAVDSSDEIDDTSEPGASGGGDTALVGYEGGVYEWRSDDGADVKTLAVYVTNGAVEIKLDDDQKYASYNSLSEVGTFIPIEYVMSGDIAGSAAFDITVNTVTVTYENFPDEPLVYKRV